MNFYDPKWSQMCLEVCFSTPLTLLDPPGPIKIQKSPKFEKVWQVSDIGWPVLVSVRNQEQIWIPRVFLPPFGDFQIIWSEIGSPKAISCQKIDIFSHFIIL